jgi:hypothetical protein
MAGAKLLMDLPLFWLVWRPPGRQQVCTKQ